MSATLSGGCLYVTKSVRIPLDSIFLINQDRYTGRARIITERGPTYVEEPIEELRELAPDLCEDK